MTETPLQKWPNTPFITHQMAAPASPHSYNRSGSRTAGSDIRWTNPDTVRSEYYHSRTDFLAAAPGKLISGHSNRRTSPGNSRTGQGRWELGSNPRSPELWRVKRYSIMSIALLIFSCYSEICLERPLPWDHLSWRTTSVLQKVLHFNVMNLSPKTTCLERP